LQVTSSSSSRILLLIFTKNELAGTSPLYELYKGFLLLSIGIERFSVETAYSADASKIISIFGKNTTSIRKNLRVVCLDKLEKPANVLENG
jgi:hypothetical protein